MTDSALPDPIDRLRAAARTAGKDDAPTLAVRDVVGLGTAKSHLVIGDARDALRALARPNAPDLTAQVDLCYLDPPFNTGERFSHYHDARTRSAWTEFVGERLELIAPLLSPTGSIWLHLDDKEQHIGRVLLDEVFGPGSFVATVIWQKRMSRDSRKAFSSMHDYIHVYAPSGPKAWKLRRNALPDTGGFSNPDNDPRGPWRSIPLTAQAGHATNAQFYVITSPAGERHNPPIGRCWTYTKPRFEELVRDERIYWPRNGAGKPRLKRYRDEVDGVAPFTLWMADDVGDNARAKKELLALFPDRPPFDTPKPESLIERVVHIGSDPGDLVLDCFAGTGTTLAVAQKMNRRWVGVELSDEVARTFTVPRLERVMAGTDAVGTMAWTGGGSFEVLTVEPSTNTPSRERRAG